MYGGVGAVSGGVWRRVIPRHATLRHAPRLTSPRLVSPTPQDVQPRSLTTKSEDITLDQLLGFSLKLYKDHRNLLRIFIFLKTRFKFKNFYILSSSVLCW